MRAPLEVRFWAKVERRGPGECWPWLGCTNRWRGQSGYGLLQHKGKNLKAHRVAYELANGPIHEGEGWHGVCVLHRCDNRTCVNPAHLFLGTNTENMRDMAAKGRGSLQTQPRDQRGEKNLAAKLDAAAVVEIRAAVARGVRQGELATRFGVSQGAISFIVLGRRWGHVTGGNTHGSSEQR